MVIILQSSDNVNGFCVKSPISTHDTIKTGFLRRWEAATVLVERKTEHYQIGTLKGHYYKSPVHKAVTLSRVAGFYVSLPKKWLNFKRGLPKKWLKHEVYFVDTNVSVIGTYAC